MDAICSYRLNEELNGNPPFIPVRQFLPCNLSPEWGGQCLGCFFNIFAPSDQYDFSSVWVEFETAALYPGDDLFQALGHPCDLMGCADTK